MSLNAVKILGINITKNPKNEILEEIWKWLKKSPKNGKNPQKNEKKVAVIVTPNPEQAVLAASDKRFAQVLNNADIAIPDGIGIVWASKMLAKKQPEKDSLWVERTIPGVVFMNDLVMGASKKGLSVGLIGSYRGIALKALDCLQKTHVGLIGWATDAPSFGLLVKKGGSQTVSKTSKGSFLTDKGYAPTLVLENGNIDEYFARVVQKIVETKTQLLFVGLGAPKQEYFMERLAYELQRGSEIPPIILMAVGGSFDELSGRLPQAPLVMTRLGFKWLWRLMVEPWRIGRQLALVTFVFWVLREKFLGKNR